MSEWSSKFAGSIFDAHTHMGPFDTAENVLALQDAAGIVKTNLVSIQEWDTGLGLPQSLYMKAKYPERFTVFAGPNHAANVSGGRVTTPSLVEQVDQFVEVGCDGIKMIESKPFRRQQLEVPLTDAYFADYWARIEELDIPMLWHVADPEEFWTPELLPPWAQAKGWGYGPGDVKKEDLYAEVDAVLAAYPGLRVIFAHFYFLSADLPRMARFLDEHPKVSFDLTPGIEMLYNTSHDVDASRDFFLKYQDRIVFGTDIWSFHTADEAIARAGIVYRWLESDDTFRVPTTVDVLLGVPEDGVIRGLALPDEVLEKIYGGTLRRYAGETARVLDAGKAADLCREIGAIAQAMSGMADEDCVPLAVADAIEALPAS